MQEFLRDHLQTLLLIELIISSLIALPFLYRCCHVLCIAFYYYWVLPRWVWPRSNLQLTYTEGDKKVTVIVDPKTDYILAVEKYLESQGFSSSIPQTQTKPD